MTFISSQVPGALRRIGKEASKGTDLLDVLPLIPRDGVLLTSEEMSTSSLKQLKGLPRSWWRSKLSNQSGKNECTRTTDPEMLFLSPSISTCKGPGKEREDFRRILTIEVLRKKA